MDFGDRILFIGAHCDDIEIGCGGTAAKLAAMDRAVAFAIAADCGAERRAEAIEAAAMLGLKEEEATVRFGGLPDRLLCQHQPQLQRWMDELREGFGPTTVFVHHFDNNEDHQAVFKTAIRSFNHQTILQYYVPQMDTRRTEFSPHLTQDISKYWDTKLAMCACHRSQMEKGIYLDPESLEYHAALWFKEANSASCSRTKGYAEAFHIHIVRSVHPAL